MHVPIPAESPSRGKPIFVHRAEGIQLHVAFMLRSTQKATFRLRHLLAVIAPWKQVALGIKRHDDRRTTETFLHDLGKKSKASITDSVDAPRGVKMPQGME